MNSKQRRQHRRKQYREVLADIANQNQEHIVSKDGFKSFRCWQYIDESGFVDFVFTGVYKDKPVFWNAVMTTANGDYYDKVSSIAMDESYEEYPWEEGYQPFYSVPCEGDDGKKGYSLMTDDPNFPDEPARRVLRSKLCAKRTLEILDAKKHPLARWNVDIDESYKWGVGLHIRIDKDFIIEDDIFNFIAAYDEKGVDVFVDEDLTPVALTADEVGVELSEDERWVHWKDKKSRDCVALNIDLDE